MMQNVKATAGALIISGIVLFGCGKDDDNKPVNQTECLPVSSAEMQALTGGNIKTWKVVGFNAGKVDSPDEGWSNCGTINGEGPKLTFTSDFTLTEERGSFDPSTCTFTEIGSADEIKEFCILSNTAMEITGTWFDESQQTFECKIIELTPDVLTFRLYEFKNEKDSKFYTYTCVPA